MRPRLFLVVAATLLAAPAFASSPSASRMDDALPPQVLGLIAAADPIPLNCADGTCTALV